MFVSLVSLFKVVGTIELVPQISVNLIKFYDNKAK